MGAFKIRTVGGSSRLIEAKSGHQRAEEEIFGIVFSFLEISRRVDGLRGVAVWG